jgi:glutamate 5-kinase
MHDQVQTAQRLVVKIGSALLIKNAALDTDWLAALADDLAQAHRRGQQIIIVTSGAVSLGCAALGLARDTLSLAQSQAAAALGQIELLRGWQNALAQYELQTAQILLTPEDTEQRRRYLNARQTLTALLDMGVVPVINENDTVATQELRYGDNDRLAARVAAMSSADCLLLLSDIDGLYTADPQSHDDAEFIAHIDQITPQIEAMAGGSGSSHGSGGMVTKLQAAQIAQSAGCHMVLASGRAQRPLTALADGARASLFEAHANPLTARKNWIAGTLHPAGTLSLDDGAVAALRAGKSLLPVGITALSGDFERGDCVILKSANGTELGRGLCAYASTDARLMIGKDTKSLAANPDLAAIWTGRAEMVHRDDMVLQDIDGK